MLRYEQHYPQVYETNPNYQLLLKLHNNIKDVNRNVAESKASKSELLKAIRENLNKIRKEVYKERRIPQYVSDIEKALDYIDNRASINPVGQEDISVMPSSNDKWQSFRNNLNWALQGLNNAMHRYKQHYSQGYETNPNYQLLFKLRNNIQDVSIHDSESEALSQKLSEIKDNLNEVKITIYGGYNMPEYVSQIDKALDILG